LKIICLYKKLDWESKDAKSNEMLTNSLFHEFKNPVNIIQISDLKKLEKNSFSDIINKSTESVIEGIVTCLINKEPSFLQLNNTKKMAKSFEKFFNDSNFGTFEYLQKTGKNVFRVEHSAGINGTKFLKRFFERIFKICLKNYSFHIISNESYVCVIFR